MQIQLKSYMTAVSLLVPPHNGLHTTWPKSMLDSLRYFGTFPRRKDRRFSTSSAYTRSASLSYIYAVWHPWLRAMGDSSSSEGTHPSYFWNERDDHGELSQPASRTPGMPGSQGILCAVQAFNLLLLTRVYINDTYCDTFVWEIPVLKPASCREDYLKRSQKESDGVGISRV